MTFLGVTMS